MKTIIRARGVLEIAETKNDIPLNEDLTVNYSGWMSRIKDQWPVEKVEVERDLTQIY